MSSIDLKKLNDKAARVIIQNDFAFIEVWNNDNEWENLETYPIVNNNVHYSCLVRIMQLIEMKFEFEPFLIG